MVAVPLVYDPYDYEIDANPHPIWKRMRDEAPLYYNEQYDFYALTRFDDVLRAHLDAATFSSARTTVLELMGEAPAGFEDFMIFMDPPAHTRYRKLVSRAFTPRHIARDVWPCSSATALVTCDIRRPATVIENGEPPISVRS